MASMEALVYARVSSDQNEGRSVRDQEKECRAWCKTNGHHVRAVFTDNNIGASRWSGKARPGWNQAKEALRQGDILVVWEASRGYRDMEEFVVFRNLCAERGVTLAYSGRVYNFADADDRFVGGLDALMAERESEKIRDRVLRGQRSGRASGRPHSRPPWGYRIKRQGEWELDPHEAPRVKESVRRLLAGETQYSIHKWLEDTPGWAPATPSSLQRTIVNPAYAGIRVHRGEVLETRGAWQPLITEEQHHQLVRRINVVKMRYGYAFRPGQEPRHLLSLIAVCGARGCGKGLTHTKLGQRGSYYRCPDGHCTRAAAIMDRAVEKAIFNKVMTVNPADFDTDNPEVAAANRQIEELEDSLKDFREKAIAREISASSFAAIEKGLLQQIEELRPRAEPAAELDYATLEQLEQRWPLLGVRQRRHIVRALFRVTVIPASKGRKGDGQLLIEEI